MKLPGTIEIPIKTLTPIWTGDNDRKTSYLRATSFLGGMRFWTEALLRSLGENVCGETRCLNDPDSGQIPCAACRIFGCTGLGRSFALKIIDSDGKDLKPLTTKSVGGKNRIEIPKQSGGISRWFLTDNDASGKDGDFNILLNCMRPLESNKNKISAHLQLAMHYIIHWGTLGAKDQYGYGLIQRRQKTPGYEQEIKKNLEQIAKGGSALGNGYPTFQDFFFFSGKEIQQVRKLFEIRSGVRNGLREKPADTTLRHYFCGSLKPRSEASKYHMALSSKDLYGWGYFPRGGPMAGSRDRCLNLLKKSLATNCKDVRWKEFSSQRDTCNSSQTWDGFLHELIEKPWR